VEIPKHVVVVAPGLQPVTPAPNQPEPGILAEGERETWVVGADGISVLASQPQRLVVRSPAGLVTAFGRPASQATDPAVQQQVLAELTGLLHVTAVDWSTQMVVIVSDGQKPSSGYAVRITGVEAHRRCLAVHWSVTSPAPRDIVLEVFTHPEAVALVGRFDGPVVFDQPAT
jgi:hypothetical protein